MSAQVTKQDVPTRVVVVDFDMSFFHLVGFFVKAVFAPTPATIIVIVIAALISGFFGAMWSSIGRWH